MPLKPFDRFDHAGVRQDLEAIKDEFSARGCRIGNSHDGEITIAFRHTTAYVRKHRDQSKWRVRFWGPNRKDYQNAYFNSHSETIGYLKNGGL